MAHTPGPWRVGTHRGVWAGEVIRAGSNKGIAFIAHGAEGDSALIASAPELLSALKEAYDALDFAQAQVDSESDAIHLRRCRRKIKTVIDKAEGGRNDG